jgi:hypothetical protein
MHGRGIEDGTAPGKQYPDIKSNFFELYKQEAEAHDLAFLTKYSDDLGNTLIFVGDFSWQSTGLDSSHH